MIKKTIGIMPFRKFEGKLQVGSSTIRCDWLINHWPEAEEFKYGQEYDTIIYQKVYWPEHAKLFKGVKILDLCDADWTHWGYRFKEMIEEVDGITCSSEKLTKFVSGMTKKPVIYVPDRIDLDIIKPVKYEHVGQAKKVAWFGYGCNFCMLNPVAILLMKNNLELFVLSDKVYRPPTGYENKIKYQTSGFSWETMTKDLSNVDFLVNPQSQTGRWAFKSSNKTVIGWALGLPVALNSEDLTRFLNPDERNIEIKKRLQEVKNEYDVKLSIHQYQNLIDEIKQKKNV